MEGTLAVGDAIGQRRSHCEDSADPSHSIPAKRPRRLKRTFAWASSESENDDDNDGDVEEGYYSSSGSSSSEDTTAATGAEACHRPAVTFHSTIAEVDFLTLRAAAAEKHTDDMEVPMLQARQPPLGQRTLDRRMRRIERLRSCATVHPPGDQEGPQSLSEASLLEIAKQLRGCGFAVLSSFLGKSTTETLLQGVQGLIMRPGQLGDQNERSQILRGDEIAWPEADLESSFGRALARWRGSADELVAGLRPLLSKPNELQHVCAREPVMASKYGPGARYIRHYDNNCEDGCSSDCNGRRLTLVHYLNDIGQDIHGCHLRLAVQQGTFDVRPRADRLALFWADRRTPHEVLRNDGPTVRYALSSWYVDLKEAPQAPATRMAM